MPCPRRVDICCWNSHRRWAQAPSCCSRWHSNEPPSSSVVVLTPFHLGRSTMSVFGIIIILGLDIFRTMGLIWGKFSWACQESWQREALETEQLCEIWPVWWVCVCVCQMERLSLSALSLCLISNMSCCCSSPSSYCHCHCLEVEPPAGNFQHLLFITKCIALWWETKRKKKNGMWETGNWKERMSILVRE